MYRIFISCHDLLQFCANFHGISWCFHCLETGSFVIRSVFIQMIASVMLYSPKVQLIAVSHHICVNKLKISYLASVYLVRGHCNFVLFISAHEKRITFKFHAWWNLTKSKILFRISHANRKSFSPFFSIDYDIRSGSDWLVHDIQAEKEN